MNDKDLHKLFRELTDNQVSLPVHQKKLRARLLNQHGYKQTLINQFLGTFETINLGVISMKKNIMSFSALGVGLLAVGVISFSSMNPLSVSAAQLAEKAIEQTQQMSTEEVASINSQYQQNLAERLNEAKQDKDLRILSTSELNSWGWSTAKEDPSIKYLTYTDNGGDRFVIGLDAYNEPLFVMNFDELSKPTGSAVNEGSTKPPASRTREGEAAPTRQ